MVTDDFIVTANPEQSLEFAKKEPPAEPIGGKWIPILGNPRAGPGDSKATLDAAIARLSQLGFQPELFLDRNEFMRATDGAALQAETHCLVAAGGDGTVAWLLDLRRDAPVAILPLGSENLLARRLNIPVDVEPWIAMIVRRKMRLLDLASGGGRRFSVMASAGFDADVVSRVHRRRSGHVTRLDYLRAIARSLWRYRFPQFEGELDDGTIFQATQAFAFVQPSYALGLAICPPDEPDDGLLNVTWFERLGRWQLLRFGIATVLRLRSFLPKSQSRLSRSVRWTAIAGRRGAPVQIDGDPLGGLPIEIRVEPAAARLVTPG